MIDFADQFMPRLLRATAMLAMAALLVAVCVRLLRVRAPRLERAAWLLVLLQGVILAQVFIPLSAGLFPSPPVDNAAEAPPASTPIASEPPATPTRPPGEIAIPNEPLSREVAPIDRSSAGQAPPSWSIPDHSWTSIALVVWGAGFLIVLGIAALRYGSFVRRLRDAKAPNGAWDAHWRHVLEQGDIRAPLRLVVSRDLGPSLCRLPKETLIVVPEPLWGELEPSEQTAILRHEIEHYRRGDLWWALIARLLASLHWFNPCAWWAAARFEEQAEFACDQAAAGEEPARFGQLLLRLGSGSHLRTVGVQTMSAGNLYRRIGRLAASRPHSPRWRGIVPLAATLLIMGAATIRFSAMPSFAEETPVKTADEPLPDRAIARLGTTAFYASGFPHDVAFSPDGKLVALAEANTAASVRLYDVATGRQVARLTIDDPDTWMAACLAFAPDGEEILCGTTDGHVIVWNLADGKEVFNEELHDGDVNDVAYSPDGELLVTAGADGGILVRSARSPDQMVQELKPGNRKPKPKPGTTVAGGSVGTGPRPISVAFTPDGSKLVVGYDMGKIAIWDPRKDKLRHSFIASKEGKPFTPKQSLHTVAVMPDGKTVLTAGFESIKRDTTDLEYGPKNVRLPQVRFWELDSGELIRGFIQPDEYGYGWSALSPDGKQIAIGQVGQLVFCNIDEDRKTLYRLRIPLEGQRPDELAFSPDGKFLACALGGQLALFDAKSGERLHYDPATSMGTVLDADWLASGDRIVTGSHDGNVRVWDADTGELLWHRQLAPIIEPFGDVPSPRFVAFSPDGARVIAAGGRDDPKNYTSGIMVVFDAATGKTLREVDIPRPVETGVLSQDGRTAVLVTLYDSRCVGIDVANGEILFQTPGGDKDHLGEIEAMRFLPESKSFRVATGDSHIVQLDAATGQRQETLSIDWRTEEQKAANKPKDADLWFAAFTADAAILVSSSLNVVYRWDADTGNLLVKTEFPHKHALRLGVSPNGTIIATSDRAWEGDDGTDTIRLYDTEGNQLLTLAPNEGRARVLKFSPDGSKLFTGFYNKAPIVWDVARE